MTKNPPDKKLMQKLLTKKKKKGLEKPLYLNGGAELRH